MRTVKPATNMIHIEACTYVRIDELRQSGSVTHSPPVYITLAGRRGGCVGNHQSQFPSHLNVKNPRKDDVRHPLRSRYTHATHMSISFVSQSCNNYSTHARAEYAKLIQRFVL